MSGFRRLILSADASAELVSTSLAHIAHILVLASHYLAIRLPGQITLPHRDYPRPTIFSLGSSYKYGDIPFPGSAASTQPSPSAGDGRVPRPRPLFIDKPLSALARDDPSTYALFLEGVAILAYDIAWACCSQGVSFGDKDSYEDVSNMGQNLWRLLIGDQVHRRSVEPMFPVPLPHADSIPENEEDAEMTKPKSMIGRWSHGTAHAYLGSAGGTELIRGFKLMSPLKLVDRLKKRLLNDAPMLGWEKIEGHEADEGLEDGTLLRRHDHRGSAKVGEFDVASVMTAQTAGTSGGGSDNGTPTKGSEPGQGGWTKVKSR